MSLFAYIIATILVIAFLVYQFYPWLKLKGIRGKPAPSLKLIPGLSPVAPERVLLYFMSPECSMCRATTPIIDELRTGRHDVVRIDASQVPEIASQFNIMGTPAFVLVNEGVIEKVKLGAMSRAKILAMLEPID